MVSGPALPAAARGDRAALQRSGDRAAAAAPLTFVPVERNFEDELVTAAGYGYSVVMGWGDPVESGAPEFDVVAQTTEAQA